MQQQRGGVPRHGRGHSYPDGGDVPGPRRPARDAHCADRGGERVEHDEREHVQLVPPDGGAHGRPVRDAGGPDGRCGDALQDDQRAPGQRRDGGAGGVERDVRGGELSLQHDAAAGGLVRRGGAGVHVLPRGRGGGVHGGAAAERAQPARGRDRGRRVRLHVLGVPPLGDVHGEPPDGAVNISFTGVWGNDGDEATTGGNGVVKYGGGTVASYYGCAGIACHGDYSGGNTANTPNWYNTDVVLGANNGDGHCGTCHGTDATKDPMPAYADGTPKANKHVRPQGEPRVRVPGVPLHGDDGRGDGDEPREPREQHDVDAGAERGGGGALPVHVGGAELHGDGVPRREPGGVERGGAISCHVCHSYVGGAVTNADVNDFVWAGACRRCRRSRTRSTRR